MSVGRAARALLPAVVVVSAFVMPVVPPVARAAPPAASCAVASCARPALAWRVVGVRRISAPCLPGRDRCVRGIVARTVVFPVLGAWTPGERGPSAIG